MSSFLFPEDLDPVPSKPVICATPMSKKCRDAFPEPASRPAVVRGSSVPGLLSRTAAAQSYKDPAVFVSSIPPSEGWPRTGTGEQLPGKPLQPLLRRFGSLSLSKQEKEEQRLVKKQARMLKEMSKFKVPVAGRSPLSPVVDDDLYESGRYAAAREHGFAHIAF